MQLTIPFLLTVLFIYDTMYACFTPGQFLSFCNYFPLFEAQMKRLFIINIIINK